MTTQHSQIFRACARGEPITQIAESCGIKLGPERGRRSGERSRNWTEKVVPHSILFDGNNIWC